MRLWGVPRQHTLEQFKIIPAYSSIPRPPIRIYYSRGQHVLGKIDERYAKLMNINTPADRPLAHDFWQMFVSSQRHVHFVWKMWVLKNVASHAHSEPLQCFVVHKGANWTHLFYFFSELCQLLSCLVQKVARSILPAPLLNSHILPNLWVGFICAVAAERVGNAIFHQCPAPTQPIPHVASTSRSKCKWTLTCPTPTHPIPHNWKHKKTKTWDGKRSASINMQSCYIWAWDYLESNGNHIYT